jgi:hypothetical protein
MSDPWTLNNPVTPPFAAKTAKLMTTTSAADAMTILRRLVLAECDRRRPRVLPPIVICTPLTINIESGPSSRQPAR